MRNAELINILIFGYFAAAGWLFRIPWRKRVFLTLISLSVIVGMLALPQIAQDDSVWLLLRDWLPVPLIVLAYRQTGRFFVTPDPRFQSWLERSDRWISDKALANAGPVGRVFLEVLEACYMLCYIMVPLGLGTLYLLGFGGSADTYWTVVLIPTYLCYATSPFLQAWPPRYNGHDPGSKGPIRRFNFYILKNVSIHANTFPSGHAAAASAIGLLLLDLSLAAGIIFTIFAIGICAGAAVGRYHYTVDVVLGAALATATVALLS